ncbi:acyl-CoA carboxylase subunit epsilon [Rhizohabitans arisaemae]|uniref:acyl-CoA carboxylase subunit epsilon n=1 Tax=Rhizohabitans arisaemae TaxID=2720610 RepID=UPI0024B1B988|nr:acyl-CoA carboxylase subunit epsilon [Rhizohabitans arisaemae]
MKLGVQSVEESGITLRVVRGDPSPEEIAALVAVLAGRTGPPQGVPSVSAPVSEPLSAWTDRSALMREPLFPGSGAWRASALPR